VIERAKAKMFAPAAAPGSQDAGSNPASRTPMSKTFRPTLTDGEAIDALALLRTRTVDARAGFETMASRAEVAFRPITERLCDLHGAHASRLTEMLVDDGCTPDADGSFMGGVNRTVVATRALFDEINADVMDQGRSGEAHARQAFDEAVRCLDEHPPCRRDRRDAGRARGPAARDGGAPPGLRAETPAATRGSAHRVYGRAARCARMVRVLSLIIAHAGTTAGRSAGRASSVRSSHRARGSPASRCGPGRFAPALVRPDFFHPVRVGLSGAGCR
jgi:hypothetical protein